jgi:transposase
MSWMPRQSPCRVNRRVKTDRIEGETLIRTLMADKRGEPRVCSMVRVPTPEEEDRRRHCRERKALVAERVLHVNCIRGLLFSQGIRDYKPLPRDRRKRLEELRTGDDRALSVHIKAQICRELDRLELLLEQIKAVDAERDVLVVEKTAATPAPAAMLLDIRGIGPEFAAVLHSEGLFRHFANRRQLAAYAGLAPSPWKRGSIDREQGVSKAGNPRLRTTMIQLASMATPSTKLPAHPLVSQSRHAERRPVPKGSCRGACPQTAYSTLEICDRWRCYRRSDYETRLKTSYPQCLISSERSR